jgi:hypothetical protein
VGRLSDRKRRIEADCKRDRQAGLNVGLRGFKVRQKVELIL